MSIKVVARIFEDENPIVITTHGGDFNLDDLLSMAIFCITSYRNKVIIRNDDERYASGIRFDEIVKSEQNKYKVSISKTEAVWNMYGERIVKQILKSYKESVSIAESEKKVKRLADLVCQKSFKQIIRSNGDPNYIPSVYSYFDLFKSKWRENDYDSIFERLLDYTMYYVKDEIIVKTVLRNFHKV